MASSSGEYHEPYNLMQELTLDMHRALVSVQEELEAIDWYRQRADVCKDEELREILLHNMREEMEHAAMLMEWIRRRDSDFGEHMGTYLFTKAPILQIEEEAEEGGTENGPSGGEETRPEFSVGMMKGW